MKPRTLLLLGVALLACLAGAWLARRLHRAALPELYPELGQPILPGLEAAAVEAVALRQGGAAFVLRRQADGSWVVETGGRRRPADPESLRYLLEGLTKDSRLADVRSPAGLEPQLYGLEGEAALQVELALAGGGRRRFSVGRESRNEGAALRFELFYRYADRPRVYIAENIRAYRFGLEGEGDERLLSPRRFYQTCLFEIPPAQAARIAIQAGAERLAVEPDPAAPPPAPESPALAWRIAATAGLPEGVALARDYPDAGRLLIDTTLYAFELQACFFADYYDGPRPAPGLDPPAAVVTATRRDGRSFTLRLGREAVARRQKDLYPFTLDGSDEVYLVFSDEWWRRARPPAAYVRLPLFSVPRAQVAGLVIESGGERLELAPEPAAPPPAGSRDRLAWRIAGRRGLPADAVLAADPRDPERQLVDADLCAAELEDCGAARREEPGAPAPPGLEPPLTTLALALKDGRAITLALGGALVERGGRNYYPARLAGDDTVYLFYPEEWSRLSRAPSRYLRLPASPEASPESSPAAQSASPAATAAASPGAG